MGKATLLRVSDVLSLKYADIFTDNGKIKKNATFMIKRLSNSDNLKITGLDLHFDGHNGDHLLLYAKTNQQIIYLVGIGSHSDLF